MLGPTGTGAVRLAYLLGSYPVASETFLARELAGLRAQGLGLDLYALGAGEASAEVVARRPPWWQLRWWLPVWRRPSALTRILAACLRRPRRALSWLRNLPTAAWLAASTAEADLVHAAWAGLPAQVAWMARQLGGRPYTVAGHAADVFTADRAADVALREACGVTVCNRGAWRELARVPGVRPRLVYHPHGLPLAAWPYRGEARPAPPLVLAVGRLVEKKGFDVLLAAVAALEPRPALALVGDGPARPALEALAARLGLTVTWAGQVSEAHVRRWLSAASVLVLPSRVNRAGDRDGLANVLLEALASGVPVLSTAAGSATDVVRDGRTGLLVQPDDPAALARALAWMLADEARAARLARAGRALVEHRYDLRVNTGRLAEWFRVIVGTFDGR